MPFIQEMLNQIWGIFRRSGIADDLAIIEYIAAILTSGMEFPDDILQPRKPPKTIDLNRVQKLLEEASEIAGGEASLFDRHVIMRLSSMLPGGRYPTPRHIVDFVYQIVHVERTDSLADLACGSGGFLVRPEWTKLTRIVGTEISTEWARIAYANCLLQGAGRC